MTTFRAETTGGLDTTHPLASTVAFAILPNEGSDNVLTELLRNDTLDFSTDGLTWNADGSVSASTASDDLNLAWSNTHSIVLKDYVSGLAFSKSFILLADVFIGASSGNPRNTFIALDTTTANKSQAYILADNYSDGLQMAARIDFSTPKGTDNDPYTESVGVRTLAVIVWDSVASTFRFIDSAAGYDSTQAETGTETSNDWAGVKIGTGDNLDKLYAAYMLERDGQFTAEEIDSIIADPYQIFRTAEDAVNDYGLKWGDPSGNDGGMIDISGIVGDAHIEMGLVDTLPDSWSFLVDAREGGAGTGLFLNKNGGVAGKLAITEITNFKSNGTPLPWVSGTGNDISLAEAGTLSFDLSAAGHGNGIIRIGSQRSPSNDYPYRNLNLRFIKITDDNGLHYIDLNRTQGNPVDLTGNLTCTLAGFPTESGYVRELDGIDGVLVGTTEVDILPKPARGPATFEATLMFKGSETVLFGADTNANTTRYRCYLSASGKVKVRIKGSEDTSGNIEYNIDTGVIVPDDGAFHTLKIIQQFTVDCLCDVTLDTNPKVTANLGVNMYDVSWSRINNFVLFADRFHTYAVVGNSSSNTTKFKRIEFNSDVWDFTQTTAYTVPSTTGAASITLTGVNPVYRPEASGEILGYKFNGTVRGEINPEITPMNNPTMEIEIDFITDNNGDALFLKDAGSATTYWQISNNVFRAHYKSSGGSYNTFAIPFTILPNTRYTAKVVKRSQTEHEFYINGDSIGTSTVSTGLTADGWSYMGWQGSQTLISMKIRDAENGTLLHDWDFTSGDVDTFRDKVGTAHATITSTKTSGWMPISQKQVFTIRANGLGDYSSMSAAVAAQAKNLVEANETQEFLFFNDWPTGLNDNHHFSGYVTSPNNWLMLTVPESERCVGGDITTGFHIKNDVNSNPPIRPVPGCEHIMVTGLGFSAGSGSGFAHNNGGGKGAIVQDCTFNGVGVGSVANGNASYKRNYIIDTGGDGILATQGFCHYLDNIVVRAGNRGLVTYGDTVSANNLIYNSTGVDISNQGGTLFNNVTSDNTGDIPDIDFTGAFVDG